MTDRLAATLKEKKKIVTVTYILSFTNKVCVTKQSVAF